jgi:hypothetical protein
VPPPAPAAGRRHQLHAGDTSAHRHHTASRDSLPGPLGAGGHDLGPWGVGHLAHVVDPRDGGTRDRARGSGGRQVEQREVGLGHLPALELPGELSGRPRRGREEEHARHRPVEPMRHPEEAARMPATGVRRRAEQPPPHERLRRVDAGRRLRRQPGGLGHREHAGRLVQHRQGRGHGRQSTGTAAPSSAISRAW